LKPSRTIAIIWLLSALLAATALGSQGIDPRRVSVLYTGDPYPGVTPYLSMKEDAFTVVTPVQASFIHYAGISAKDIKKSMRIYMARTYQEYVEKYDVMILSDSFRGVFTSEQTFWFRDGVLDHDIGLLMVGGWESFGGSWTGSPVEEVLPVSFPTNIWVSGYIPIEVTPEGYENEFMSSLPYKPLPEYMRTGTDGNFVEQKEGSTLLAGWRVKAMQYEDPPCYVTWEIEGGRTFAMCHDWTPGGGWLMSKWDYYRDYSVNLMLYLAGRSLPSGHLEIHEYRKMIHDLAISKSMLYSLLEFVESFGGNSGPIDDRVGELDFMVSGAQGLYLDHDFTEALANAQEARAMMREIEALAVELKNEALFWVYLVEWLSVTGVALLSGTVVWFIMVQRRLYREVKVTRSRDL
jgi:uncharacterized membrane protein